MAAATFMTDITEIITQAVEAAAMIGSLWSSFKVVDQARDYYNLYNAQRQFYYSTFQIGAEAPLAATVYNTNIAIINYIGADAELYKSTGIFGGNMGDSLGWWQRHAAVFGTTQSAPILNEEYTQDRALLFSHWANIMFRFEESNADLLNDIRWDHRMKLHNVGLKQQSNAVSGLAVAEGQREDTLTRTSSYFAEMSGSLAERRGLVQAHKDVQARYAAMANGQLPQLGSTPTPPTYHSQPMAQPSAQGNGVETFPLGTMPAIGDHFRRVN